MQAEPGREAPTTSLDDLIQLPYFDFMARLGHFPLHPGGLEATASVLAASGVAHGDRVLEVGCGNGVSTHLMLQVGLDVHVAEPNASLLASMARHCREHTGKVPHSHHTRAEELHGIADHSMKLVLFEAVLGFVTDQPRAMVQCRRVLERTMGKLAIVDFHYREEPPAEVRRGLAEVVGQEVSVMFDADWRELLRGFRPVLWESFELRPLSAPSLGGLRAALVQSKALTEVDALSDRDLERILARLHAQMRAFEDNRRYLAGHRIVASVPFT